MQATTPRPRSPAQIAAARRNGARWRGPVIPEGKAKSSRNALKHGLAALHHFVLEEEAPSELEELTARLIAECAPESEIDARLVKRMAIAFWKGERAERIEVALFDAAPKLRPPQAGFAWEQADPLTTFDLKRFNAVRGYQAQQGRELSRCLKELRMLRRDSLAECTGEPESTSRNEPKAASPANDDGPPPRVGDAPQCPTPPRNEPEPPADPAAAASDAWLVEGVPLLDIWGRPRPQPSALASDRAGGTTAATDRPRPTAVRRPPAAC